MHGFITNPKSDANWLNLGFILPFDFSVLALSIIVDALSIKTSSGTPPMISKAFARKSNKYFWLVDGVIVHTLNLDAESTKLPTLSSVFVPSLNSNLIF